MLEKWNNHGALELNNLWFCDIRELSGYYSAFVKLQRNNMLATDLFPRIQIFPKRNSFHEERCAKETENDGDISQ